MQTSIHSYNILHIILQLALNSAKHHAISSAQSDRFSSVIYLCRSQVEIYQIYQALYLWRASLRHICRPGSSFSDRPLEIFCRPFSVGPAGMEI